MSVFVLKEGKVSLAVGAQPKDALLFAPSKQAAQAIQEDRARWKRDSELMRERFALAARR
ncbi:hypothetical protein ACFFSY_34365 [Paenibacillus aurantiacus]|uniref:Uncharacterized protein n=1 Tax=Paenibacillus aurantiacus TaxID=1936118 RepID=A0ABV5L2P7_9BACL